MPSSKVSILTTSCFIISFAIHCKTTETFATVLEKRQFAALLRPEVFTDKVHWEEGSSWLWLHLVQPSWTMRLVAIVFQRVFRWLSCCCCCWQDFSWQTLLIRVDSNSILATRVARVLPHLPRLGPAHPPFALLAIIISCWYCRRSSRRCRYSSFWWLSPRADCLPSSSHSSSSFADLCWLNLQNLFQSLFPTGTSSWRSRRPTSHLLLIGRNLSVWNSFRHSPLRHRTFSCNNHFSCNCCKAHNSTVCRTSCSCLVCSTSLDYLSSEHSNCSLSYKMIRCLCFNTMAGNFLFPGFGNISYQVPELCCFQVAMLSLSIHFRADHFARYLICSSLLSSMQLPWSETTIYLLELFF